MSRSHRPHSRHNGETREIPVSSPTSPSMLRYASHTRPDNIHASMPTNSHSPSAPPQSNDPAYDPSSVAQETRSHQQSSNYSHYYAIPRPWGNVNREVYHAIQNPALRSAPFSSSLPRGGSPHHHSSSTRRASHANSHAPSRHQPSGGGNRLTQSNLGQFNDSRASTTNVAMWMDENPRHGAWNGVGYVGAESDYDQNRRNGDP